MSADTHSSEYQQMIKFMEGQFEVYNDHETAKTLKSSFNGLKLLKLSELWSETKNNRLDKRMDGTQIHKLQDAINSQ